MGRPPILTDDTSESIVEPNVAENEIYDDPYYFTPRKKRTLTANDNRSISEPNAPQNNYDKEYQFLPRMLNVSSEENKLMNDTNTSGDEDLGEFYFSPETRTTNKSKSSSVFKTISNKSSEEYLNSHRKIHIEGRNTEHPYQPHLKQDDDNDDFYFNNQIMSESSHKSIFDLNATEREMPIVDVKKSTYELEELKNKTSKDYNSSMPITTVDSSGMEKINERHIRTKDEYKKLHFSTKMASEYRSESTYASNIISKDDSTDFSSFHRIIIGGDNEPTSVRNENYREYDSSQPTVNKNELELLQDLNKPRSGWAFPDDNNVGKCVKCHVLCYIKHLKL